ncbi:hypothetical protein DNU06_08435 [Putridiphycobacter roseus]|uniref:Aromatic hydrocarbon degradation protein n=1 Tax=Putridiphycobacter roseus TaxID=2219161 RepID=A0A2W1NRK1_9FLAO|nr:outer membrane protein transport protein [Putridiphycobacter roseus]PZE17288.1 hypothetical protein DNU06_08435 [Putridiphycobacter roseus]
MKVTLSIFILLLMPLAYGQNEEDALRYSSESLGGTARNIGMGGAMTALGGDYSATLKNPAAIGKFIKSNFSFTSFVEQNVSETSFRGNIQSQDIFNYKLGNLSYVKAYELNPRNYNNWMGVQLGIGYNRKQSFNKSFSYNGSGSGSIIDYFIVEAGNTDPDLIYGENRYSAGLAYDNYVIDPYINDSGIYYDSDKSGDSKQSRRFTESGGMGEVNFSISGNYNNKLLVGASLNIVTLNYDSRFTHNESFADTSSSIQTLDYSGYLNVNGSGVNLRIGTVFMPYDFIRIGLAIETPTRLVVHEKFGNDMRNESVYGIYETDNETQPTGAFDYIVITPFKANLSIGLIDKKLGSIGMELEVVDYSMANMKSLPNADLDFYSFNTENAQIENLYNNTFNFKIGAEGRITNQLYLRAGYAIFGSAYKDEKNVYAPPIQNYTGGIGYNFGSTYIDFAAVFQQENFNHVAYSPDIEGSIAGVKNLKKQFVLTFGARF